MTPKLKTFLERGFSTILLLSILGGAVAWNHPTGYGVLICLLCNLTTWEWFCMLKGKVANRLLVLMGGIIYPWLLFLLPDGGIKQLNFAFGALVVYCIAAFLCNLFGMDYRQKNAAEALSATGSSILAFIYPVWLFSLSLIFIHSGHSIGLMLWLILFTKMSDIWAYVSGVLLGGRFISRRFSPVVSPKKTWEGIIGSFILTMTAGYFLLPLCCPDATTGSNLLVEYFYIAPILFILSVAGDLAGSLIKRGLEVKDSGSLLPGIGGIFDLIDSPAFTVGIFTAIMAIS